MLDEYEALKHYYNVEPLVDMKCFVELLLADLASKDTKIFTGNSGYRTASLSADYKDLFETIIYKKELGREFSCFIDLDFYYSNQLIWELEFKYEIIKFANKPNKIIKTDINNNTIEIDLTLDEINKIKSQYDKDLLEKMDYLTDLLDILKDEKANKIVRKVN